MAIIAKPCEGKLSQETKEMLRSSRSRAGWGVYPCEVCGQVLGVEVINGDWVPEKHWPSVVYPPRKPGIGRFQSKREASE